LARDPGEHKGFGMGPVQEIIAALPLQFFNRAIENARHADHMRLRNVLNRL
jgi:hypothetical protein